MLFFVINICLLITIYRLNRLKCYIFHKYKMIKKKFKRVCLNTITNILSGGKKGHRSDLSYIQITILAGVMILNLNLCSLIFSPFARTNLFIKLYKFFVFHMAALEKPLNYKLNCMFSNA